MYRKISKHLLPVSMRKILNLILVLFVFCSFTYDKMVEAELERMQDNAKSREEAVLGESIRGTVQYIPLEGGFYGIIDSEGNRYDPTNLDPEFEKHGLKVVFEGEPCEKCYGFHMWGQIYNLTKIKKQE